MKPIQFMLGILMFILFSVNVIAIPTITEAGVTGAWNGTYQTFYSYWDSSSNVTSNVTGYIFSWDNSGVMENGSYTDSDSPWVNTSKTLNATPDLTLTWKLFVNTTENEWEDYTSAFTITSPLSTDFGSMVCPTSNLQNTLMFIFFGLILAFMIWWGDSKGLAALMIVGGIMIFFYSIPLFACNMFWGLSTCIIGLFVMLYAVFWKIY